MKKQQKYKRLSVEELITVFVMYREEKRFHEIGKKLNRSHNTIRNAVNNYRHRCAKTWSRMDPLSKARYVKNKMSDKRQGAGRRELIVNNRKLIEFIIDCLVNLRFSPEQVATKVKAELGLTVSTKSIYNYIKKHRKSLKHYLRHKGVPARQRVKHRRSRFYLKSVPKKRYIEERSEIVNKRLQVGNWECDTVISKKKGSKYAILSLRERLTRKRVFIRIPDLKAATSLSYLRAFFLQLPADLRKSITFDNGSEFAVSEMIKLEQYFSNLKIYYCEPYQSQQKGAVENSNGEFRIFFPKGTDFGFVSKAEVKSAQDKLNMRPMRCLNKKSADEVFNQYLAICA